MPKTIAILLSLFLFGQVKAQLATNLVYVSSNYKDVIVKNGITIAVRAVQGRKSAENATLYWQIRNSTGTDIFLDGNFVATGKPITAKLSNGDPAGKNKTGGALPSSRVNANSTQEFPTPAEWVNDVDKLTVTLYVIHKGSNIHSGNGN